jgi:transcriptional regulator with XRE-family HTH domain
MRERLNEIGIAVRELREASGVSGRELARRAFFSQTKVHRIESGEYVPTLLDIEAIARALELDPATLARLAAMVRQARTEHQSSRHMALTGWEHRQRALINLDSLSKNVQYFLPGMLCGLLQTPEYAYASCNHPATVDGADPAAVAEAKLSRQCVLDGDTQFTFLLTRCALTWPLLSADQMRQQHKHLIEVAHRPNISIRVIDESQVIRDGPVSMFIIYDDRLVAAELFSGEVTLTDPANIGYHQRVFDYFLSVAHSEEKTRDLLIELI